MIRVALADDHPVVLAGIRALLAAADDVTLVGEAAAGHAALGLIEAARPDVAVVDISMPDLNGLEIARRVARACPSVRLLALTVHEDRAYVQQLLHAGGRGYLLKRSAADELLRAVRIVASGGLYLDPAIAGKALSGSVADRTGGDSAASLSPREEDVLRFTAQGLSNKEIAARLEISTKTVETYKARGIEKLGLRTRADIVRHGAGHGWLDGIDRPTPIP